MTMPIVIKIIGVVLVLLAVLYLVKPGPDVFITSVQPADTQNGGSFREYEGFMVK